jgi:hypothetical protein
MTVSVLVVGFLQRFIQVFLESALTLVVGLIVAGVLRRMVGPAGTRRLFGRGLAGLFRGWVVGMLLPVCSLGVIPVAREMRRAGVSGGTVLSFVLAAPLLNPISFFYGLTLAEPFVICCFAAASLLLSTWAGWLWDRVFARGVCAAEAEAAAATAEEPRPAAGPRRLLAVVVTASREWIGPNFPYYVLGLVGSAILAALIPFGYLQPTMKHSDWASPYLMLILALPIYSSPLPGMMKIGLMFDHGNSVAAAFLLFILGIGTNLGLLAWLLRTSPPLRFLGWFAAWVAMVLTLALVAEPLLYDQRKAELDHTHAFDDYANPFPAGTDDWLILLESARKKLAERFEPMEQFAVGTLLLFTLIGWPLRRPERASALERWLTVQPPPTQGPTPWWNRPIPGPILGGIALAGLIAASVMGVYIFYPPPEQTLTMLSHVRADALVAVRTGKHAEAIRHLELMDLLVRKLQVGVYIRRGTLSPQARQAADDLREICEEIRDLLLTTADEEHIRPMLPLLEERYRQCRQAFSD